MLHSTDIFPSKPVPNSDTSRGYFRRIQQVIHGASNVFLVEADNVHEAVRASSSVILSAQSVRIPVRIDAEHAARDNYWLVAYIGAGPSEPTWWTIERVTAKGNTIRIAYRESPPAATTQDVHMYYYWIPIGRLESGVYKLELYDAARRLVTLMRRVEVEAKNN
jgi:hypothetical protein